MLTYNTITEMDAIRVNSEAIDLGVSPPYYQTFGPDGAEWKMDGPRAMALTRAMYITD